MPEFDVVITYGVIVREPRTSCRQNLVYHGRVQYGFVPTARHIWGELEVFPEVRLHRDTRCGKLGDYDPFRPAH